MDGHMNPPSDCPYVVQLKTGVLKDVCNFPPSLGSLVGQIHEKRNPSRAIRNKDRKSLSCRSQEAGEASHQDRSVLALFPGHLPTATGIGINYPAVVLYVIATPENNTCGCRTKTPAAQKRASFRVSNESTIFHDLTPLKKEKKRKLAAIWQRG